MVFVNGGKEQVFHAYEFVLHAGRYFFRFVQDLRKTAGHVRLGRAAARDRRQRAELVHDCLLYGFRGDPQFFKDRLDKPALLHT